MSRKPKTAEEYVRQIDDKDIKKLALTVRAIIKNSVPEAQESLKMGIPCYSSKGKMFASMGTAPII